MLFRSVFLDRFTKWMAEIYLKGNQRIGFLNDMFILTYAENTGAFLSLGRNWPILLKYVLLLVIPIIICVYVFVYCLIKEKDKLRIVLLISIIAGGIGNLFDRIFNDFTVIDFMNFGIGKIRTGILNIADLSVTFGVIVLIIYEIRKRNKFKNSLQ